MVLRPLLTIIVLLASSRSQASSNTFHYVGTRERTFSIASDNPNLKPFDDRYTVVDDQTVRRTGTSQQREDHYDFEPVGMPVESPAPEVAQRVRFERIVHDGRQTIVVVTKQLTTTDHQSAVPSVTVMGVAQEETTTTTYATPHVAFAIAGPARSFVNGIARSERGVSSYSGQTRDVRADGSISDRSGAAVTTRAFTQSPNGSAHDNASAIGFYTYDLAIDPPVWAANGKTIHVVRATTGRAVGPNPTVTKVFDVPDWYPGGVPGAESDVVRSLGDVALPGDCGRPLGASRGYASLEKRTLTLATGDVTIETTRTFTEGDTVLCTTEDRRVRTYDPTTGRVVSMSSDVQILHLAGSTIAERSLVLVAPHVMPIHHGVDRHVTGAPALVLEAGHVGYVGMRVTPADIDDADASIAISSPLADAKLDDGGLIEITAGAAPGHTMLDVRLRGVGHTVSFPIFIYRSVAVGCEADQMRSAIFTAYGSVEEPAAASQADVYVDCKDERYTQALHFPLGATVLRFENDDAAPFTTVRADSWQPQVTVLDDASEFASRIRTPESERDSSQNILLIKTHTGEIVKVHCDGKNAYALVGAYSISKAGIFAN